MGCGNATQSVGEGGKNMFKWFLMLRNGPSRLRKISFFPQLRTYSQNFLRQILKIFVTLRWICEVIPHQKEAFY
jgi:hypothetical protein